MEDEKQKQIEELRQTVEELKASLGVATEMLGRLEGKTPDDDSASLTAQRDGALNSKVIEGVFDGKDMVGPDNRRYTVPANYASKSKLVEGDRLKLSIMEDGTFVYKQIGPIERKRVRATLMYDEDLGEYQAMAEGGRTYKLIKAAVTYYHGDQGDEVIILLPEDNPGCRWAAVENIIKELT